MRWFSSHRVRYTEISFHFIGAVNVINTLYLPELREMLELSDVDGLRTFCTALHPARTAEFMGGLTAPKAWTVLQSADPPTRVEIFGYLDRPHLAAVAGDCDPGL